MHAPPLHPLRYNTLAVAQRRVLVDIAECEWITRPPRYLQQQRPMPRRNPVVFPMTNGGIRQPEAPPQLGLPTQPVRQIINDAGVLHPHSMPKTCLSGNRFRGELMRALRYRYAIAISPGISHRLIAVRATFDNGGGGDRMPKKSYASDMARRVRLATLARVGRHLRLLRTALGHSQQQWAYALQITPQLLNKWEKGTRQPNIDVLIRICNSFGCTLDFIFRGEAHPAVTAPELYAKLSAVPGVITVATVSHGEPPRPPDQSIELTPPSRAPRKRKTARPRRVSTRRKPPTAPGGSSKS